MSLHAYCVDTAITSYVYTARLNGFAFATNAPGVCRYGFPANTWIVDGDNTLEIELVAKIPIDPDEAPDDEDEPEIAPGPLQGERVTLTLETGMVERELGTGAVSMLSAIDIHPIRVHTFPHVARTDFRVDSPFPRWRWQNAQFLGDDEDTWRDAIAFVRTLHASLAAGDIATVLEHYRNAAEEFDIAFGDAPGTQLNEVGEFWRDMCAAPGFRMVELDIDQLSRELHCGGRLICVAQADGEDMLRERPSAQGYRTVPCVIGKIDGRWEVLRF